MIGFKSEYGDLGGEDGLRELLREAWDAALTKDGTPSESEPTITRPAGESAPAVTGGMESRAASPQEATSTGSSLARIEPPAAAASSALSAGEATPRTDALYARILNSPEEGRTLGDFDAMTAHARQLERELTSLRSSAAEKADRPGEYECDHGAWAAKCHWCWQRYAEQLEALQSASEAKVLCATCGTETCRICPTCSADTDE